MAEMRDAVDGYAARLAKSWTEEKLMVLDCYLRGFAKACKGPGWYALDLFAGVGLNWSATRDQAIRGSPLIALEAGEPKATKLMACEKHRGARQALEYRCAPYGDRAQVLAGDVNEQIGVMLAPVPRRAPAFAFPDPEGSELAWPTVEAIAAHKRGHHRYKVEQLILFPTDLGFMRTTGVAPESVTRIFGHERWREIAAARQAGEITADDARGRYVQLYAEGLRGLGYATVLDREVMGLGGQRRYFLIFATDNDAGRKIMDHCFSQVKIRVQEARGQGQLFPTREPDRSKRL